jgi:O-antigen/teichoic acid export membrane protein
MGVATLEQSTDLFVASDSALVVSSGSTVEVVGDANTASFSPTSSKGSKGSTEARASITSPHVSSSASVAAGATVLTLTMFVSNAGNYMVNVLLGRWLTPSQFADATLMVTLMLVATALAISLQLIAAKLLSDHNETAIAWLCARALYVGLALAVVLISASGTLSSFFNTQSAWPFVVLGLGMPFYVVAAVGRGVLQGRLAFRSLAASFGTEMVVRAVFSIGLVAAGFGVLGATIGLALSFVATWLFVRHTTTMHWAKAQRSLSSSVSAIAKPVALLLVAQVIINNEDVLFSKRFLEAQTAGRYGAVALIGRGVFFASWAVAMAVFPAASARTTPVGKADRLLMTALGAVIGIGLVSTCGAYFLGDTALGMVFGPAYASLATPLALYAVVTTLFAVSNLFATYHLSTGNSIPSAMLLVGGLVQSTLLLAKHGSIDDLVRMQFIAMLALTLCVAGYHFLGNSVRTRTITTSEGMESPFQAIADTVPSRAPDLTHAIQHAARTSSPALSPFIDAPPTSLTTKAATS